MAIGNEIVPLLLEGKENAKGQDFTGTQETLLLLGRVYPDNRITVRQVDELCNVPGEPCYRLTICNAGDGVVYHRQSARSPPKLKYQTCHLTVNHVWKVTDGSFVFKQFFPGRNLHVKFNWNSFFV